MTTVYSFKFLFGNYRVILEKLKVKIALKADHAVLQTIVTMLVTMIYDKTMAQRDVGMS